MASALEDISLNRDENGDRGRGDWNVDSRNDAQSLLNAITFTFIVAIVVVRHIVIVIVIGDLYSAHVLCSRRISLT